MSTWDAARQKTKVSWCIVRLIGFKLAINYMNISSRHPPRSKGDYYKDFDQESTGKPVNE
jgi:hypothetical protein